MSWNYRVLVFPDGDEEYMEICEVYYDIEGEPDSYGRGGNPFSYTGSKGFEELFDRYRKALSKPFLWGDKRFPKVYEKED